MSSETFSCIFCKQSFDDKETLQIHFRKHADPNFSKNSKLTSVTKQNEDSNESEKQGGKPQEMVSCDVCPQVFLTISKAITHKHKAHPDLDIKYFCAWCGKLFTLKYLYQKHLETHPESLEKDENPKFQCDSCNVEFCLPNAMLHHNKFFHRQDSELPNIGQSRKTKLVCQELLPIYFCPFCGEEYINKVNLHKHIGDDHSDEDQRPEDVFSCPLCEALFYHLDAYELHLTFHSVDDIYCADEKKMPEGLTEYTLETVPPILEKVENSDPPEEGDVVGVNHFLQIAMDEETESPTSDGLEKKSKKRKKHKKSKKASITLDEFLSMNEDVFGQGIDFQGIEVVPTQAVTKQLKPKRLSIVQQNQATFNLEKLKKQGIVIKKPGAPQSIKIGNNTIPIGQTLKIPGMLKSLPVATNAKQPQTSSDVLSKLINSGLKVIKKSTPASEQSGPYSEEKISNESGKQNEDDETIGEEMNFTKNNSENEDNNKDALYPEKEPNENPEEEEIKEKGNPPQKSCNFIVKSINPGNASQESTCKVFNNNSNISTIDNLKRLGNLTVKTSTKTESSEDVCSSNITDKGIVKSINPGNSSQESTCKVFINNSNISTIDNLKRLGNLTVKTSTKTESSEDVCSSNITDKGNDKTQENTASPSETETPTNSKPSMVSDSLGKDITIKSLKTKSDIERDDNDDEDNNKIKSLMASNVAVSDSKNCCVQLESLKNVSGIRIKSTLDKNDSESFSEDDEKPLKPLTPMKQVKNKQNSASDEYDSDDEHALSKCKKNNTKHTKTESFQALKNLSGITIKASTNNTYFSDEDNEPLKPLMEKNKQFDNPFKNVCKSVTVKSTKNMLEGETMSEEDHNDNENECTKEQAKLRLASDTLSNKTIDQQKVIPPKTITTPSAKSQQSSDLLKSLINISAKPVMKGFENDSIKDTNQVQLDANKKGLSSSGIDKNIEIFNIDDSDDEDHTNNLKSNSKGVNQIINTEKNSQHYSALKNIGKNLTMTSIKVQNTQAKNTDSDDNDDMESDDEHMNDRVNTDTTQPHNPVLSKVLKNLGHNITVKSRNASPQSRLIPMNENKQDNDESDNYNSDSDTSLGKVRITEVSKEHASDDEAVHSDKGATLEYPESDHDEGDDDETVQQPNNSKQSVLDRLKDITVKQKTPNDNACHKNKPVKRQFADSDDDADVSQGNVPSKCIKNLTGSSAQFSNQLGSASKSQVSTTVKRLQTQTVIEEVTTTVTKTIRTVNQTVQGIHNSATTTKVVRPQIVIPNQQSYQGIRVRSATPSMQSQTKVMSSPARPAMCAIRPPYPSNQLVPMRPTSNQLVPFRPPNQATMVKPRLQTARMSRPRLPAMNKPSTSSFVHNTNKPLRISPNVINSTTKRPPSNVNQGNCFKKPRLPINLKDGHNGNYMMSTQMSKSNFTSSTKVVKGNTVMQSTQMKTEMSASCQQLGNLGNVSGLKVVKTQAKQTTHVTENNDDNIANSSTLSAIEKLQRQGLLVKKPVVEENNDSDHFFSDEEDYQEFQEG